MKLKACSLVFSSTLPADLFPGLGESRPRFLLPFAGRFTYLDFLLSPLARAGVRQHLVVTRHHAELAHNYMEMAWGEGGWKVFPFIPDEGDEPFDKQMYSVFKDELAAYVFLAQVDHPCWFDVNDLVNELGMRVKAVQPVFGKRPGGVILVERALLLEVLADFVKKAVPAAGVLARAFQVLARHTRLKQVPVEGFYLPINTLGQYIKANLAVLDQQERFRALFTRVPLQSGLGDKSQALIEGGAEFFRSSLADRCVVRGRIFDSVLFPGVEIGKNTEVRGAVILPDVKIGDNARIARCLIDTAGILPQNVKVQIGDGVKIGNEKSRAASRDFSEVLDDGFSYVGSSVVIPKNVTIGGACYVAPGLGKAALARQKNLAEGRSLYK